MKKRIFSIVMAAMMTGTLAMTMPTSATPVTSFGAGTAITGNNQMENPIINVVVPTTVSFAIDQFEQKDAGSQIYSPENILINKSNVAVKIDVDMKVAKKNGGTTDIDFATAKDKVKTDTTNSMWLAAIPAKQALTTTLASADTEIKNNAQPPAIIYAYIQDPTTKAITASTTGAESNVVYSTVSEVDTGAKTFTSGTGVNGKKMTYKDIATTKGVYDIASPAANVTLGAEDKTMSFALAAANNYILEDGTRAAGAPVATGMTAFRFVGNVNNKATWTADLATITVKYTVNGMTASAYTDATKTENATTGAYQMMKPAVTGPTLTATTAPTSTQAGVFTIANMGTLTIKSVNAAVDDTSKNMNTVTGTPTAPGTFLTFGTKTADNSQQITLGTVATAYYVTNPYTITVTFSDNTTVTLAVTQAS